MQKKAICVTSQLLRKSKLHIFKLCCCDDNSAAIFVHPGSEFCGGKGAFGVLDD